MAKNHVYDPLRQEVHPVQLIRRHPSMDRVRPYQSRQINSYTEKYISFLNKVKIAPDVVKIVREMAEEGKFFTGRNFFMTDNDETAFALVRYSGKKHEKSSREGLRIIYSHCDSPCLQLKVKPLQFEWDIDKRDLHLGVELDTSGYGGIHPHQWTGRRLQVVGWCVINGRRRGISFPVYSSETSAHTDKRSEKRVEFSDAHKLEWLDLIPGDASRRELLKRLRLSGEEDFARTRLYVVPIVKADRLYKYYITGYGHDDRIGVFSSVQALLESNPKYTTIVVGFDKEEVGSGSLGGAKGKFLEKIVAGVLKSEGKRAEDITNELIREIYEKSIAINSDVDVGSTNSEVNHDREDITDEKNVAKLGYGMFVSAADGAFDGDQQSPSLVDRVMGVLQRRKVIFQTIGSPVPADDGNIASMNEFFIDRGIPTINCGVSVGSLHSPEEIAHVGDLYCAIKGYRAMIEDPRYVLKRKRKRKK